MSCPQLSIPGIPDAAYEDARNPRQRYEEDPRNLRHPHPDPQHQHQHQHQLQQQYGYAQPYPSYPRPMEHSPGLRPAYHDYEMEEEKGHPDPYDHHLQQDYYAHESGMPLEELTRVHAMNRLRFQQDMARLQAAKEREWRWRDYPAQDHQQTPSFPSIYGPPTRNIPLNRDRGITLTPQPSVSPEDPLNWSWWKKHAVLASMIPGCLLSDWTLTWGTTVFELQAPEWHMTVPAVAQSVSPGIFMQGPGGLLAVPLCQRYGRLPVLFWSQVLSLIATIGATFAPSYASFTAFRALQGFFGAAPQVIGLSIIHDMFFFHERTRKINIWAASFLIGPYLGPFISSLLLLKLQWRPDFGVLAGFYILSVLMVVVLGEETLFERSGLDKLPPGHRQPFQERQPRTIRGHITSLLMGHPARRRCPNTPTIWTVLKHQGALLMRPQLFIPSALFVTPVTMWTIGMVSTISMFVLPPAPMGYGFSYVALSMLYFAPMMGTMLAEFWGHWFNDVLARRSRRPEARLSAVYPAALVGACGLVLFGQTLAHHLSWVGLAFGWAMLCFCTLACMTAISAYLLDCFPEHAALASAWINCWRVVGGFAVVYFQMQWVHEAGPATAFGYQAVVIAAATLAVACTQIWGPAWRERFPAPAAEN